MAKLPNPVQEAAAFARNAQQELAQLRKAMKAAEDSVAGLTRAIKDPVIRPPRLKTKRTTSGPSFLEALGAGLAGSYLGSDAASTIDPGTSVKASSSFYMSSAQKASQLNMLTTLGQRVS